MSFAFHYIKTVFFLQLKNLLKAIVVTSFFYERMKKQIKRHFQRIGIKSFLFVNGYLEVIKHEI